MVLQVKEREVLQLELVHAQEEKKRLEKEKQYVSGIAGSIYDNMTSECSTRGP